MQIDNGLVFLAVGGLIFAFWKYNVDTEKKMYPTEVKIETSKKSLNSKIGGYVSQAFRGDSAAQFALYQHDPELVLPPRND